MNYIVTSVKKKRDHMTPQSDSMLGKVKKVEIFKK